MNLAVGVHVHWLESGVLTAYLIFHAGAFSLLAAWCLTHRLYLGGLWALINAVGGVWALAHGNIVS